MPKNIYTDAVLAATPYLSYVGVSINEKNLAIVAQDFANRELKAPTWNDPISPNPDDDNMVEFLGVQNAINFCFRDFKTHQDFDTIFEGKYYPGSRALAACLMRAYKEGVPILNPTYLSEIDEYISDKTLRHDTTEIPLFGERIHHLRDVGQTLRNGPQKSFAEIFEACDFRAFNHGKGIVETLVTSFDAYRDVSPYAGVNLPFQKRAMLFVMLYHSLALRSKNPRFKPIQDIEAIGPISDYQVPKTLRALGILEYTDKIANMVDNCIEIPAHSEIEIAIRAYTITAVERLLEEVNYFKHMLKNELPITMVELDYPLWNSGRKLPGNHHYTLTTAY